MTNFKMAPPVTDRQLERIEDAAFRILEEVGLTVPCASISEVLSRKAGIRVDGQLVRFERRAIEDILKSVRGCTDYDVHVMAGAYSHNYLDANTGKVRPSTLENLVTSIKISDALGFGVIAPVVPLDVVGPKQELIMERLTHEYARFSFGAGQATHVATAEAGLRMSELIGRPHGLELWIDSPLKLNGKGLEIIWQLRHLKPKVKVAGMPVIGMTAPMSVGGVLAQAAAECFGAVSALKLAVPDCDVQYRIDAFAAFSMDVRTGNVLLNGPDYLRLLTVANEICKRHGIPVPSGKSLLTSSKLPDAQAGAEKAGQCMAIALSGADCFTAAGTLSVVETFSPVQLVIDREIINVIDAYLRPMEPMDDFAIDIIKEVGPGGLFMDHESTVKAMRGFFWNPDIFSISPLYSWAAGGSTTIEERARDILTAIELSEAPVISLDVQKELHKIEEYFAAKLGGT